MQVILGFVLMIIGISYCTESIVSTHKRALRLVKQVERNEYFSFCAKIFFVSSFLVFLAKIAYLAQAISYQQNIYFVLGICIIGIVLVLFTNKRKTGMFFLVNTIQGDKNKLYVGKKALEK
ncbi:hypothetical protein [Robinsoniella peoriensis]